MYLWIKHVQLYYRPISNASAFFPSAECTQVYDSRVYLIGANMEVSIVLWICPPEFQLDRNIHLMCVFPIQRERATYHANEAQSTFVT